MVKSIVSFLHPKCKASLVKLRSRRPFALLFLHKTLRKRHWQHSDTSKALLEPNTQMFMSRHEEGNGIDGLNEYDSVWTSQLLPHMTLR